MTIGTLTGQPRADHAAILAHLSGTLLVNAPGVTLGIEALHGIYTAKAQNLAHETEPVARAAFRGYQGVAMALAESDRLMADEKPALALAYAHAALAMATAADLAYAETEK